MLQLNQIHKIFNEGTPDEKIAIDHVNLTLQPGDFVTVIGSNGAGKSTLM
ncbi:ATP-binding cassette domain-containing protein, partial [Neobacillus drentensis]